MNKMTKVTLPPPDINRLVSKLRIKVNPKIRKFKAPIGPENRLLILRQTVSALFKYERIELNYPRADEARGFAERVSYKGPSCMSSAEKLYFFIVFS